MNVKDRLIKYLKDKNIKKSHFEKEIGVSNGYINSLKESPSAEKLELISNRYSDLDLNWLLKGQGEMLINGNNEGNIQQMNLENIDIGNDNNITINNGNTEKEEGIQQKYEDSNDAVIFILKKQIEIQNVQLQEKNEQIKMLLDIIKNK